jgi:uncharacterized Zn finger protein
MIKVRPLMPSEWKRLAGQLSKQAIFAAKLLAGEMPKEIEHAFSEAGRVLDCQSAASAWEAARPIVIETGECTR